MALPFTREQFLGVFAAYNDAVWPWQVVFALLGAACFVLLRFGPRYGNAVFFLLGLAWSWSGVVYHLGFFSVVNPLARIFAALFVIHGGVLCLSPWRHRLSFGPGSRTEQVLAVCLAVYALALYPLAGTLAGHGYPTLPLFPVPCPLTIFTFACLLFVKGIPPLRYFLVPTLWALIGSSAALLFGIVEDFGLLASAVVVIALFVVRGRMQAKSAV